MDDDDDDWNLTPDELDALEKNAAAQLAQKRESSGFTGSVPLCMPGSFSSPRKAQQQLQPAASQFGTSSKSSELSCSWIYTSPSKSYGKLLSIKVFKEEGGRIACEAPYNSHLVAALKTVPGRNWDANRKVWTYPEAGLGDVIKAITSLAHLKLSVEVAPPLSVCVAPPCASVSENSNVEENEAELWCTPPQSDPFAQDHDRHTPYSEAPSVSRSLSTHDAGSSQHPRKVFLKLFLHSSGKIAARFDYDTQLVAAVKKIPRVEYHSKERLWMFPFSSLLEAEEILKNTSDRVVTIEPLEPLVKRALEATASLPDLQERFDMAAQKLKMNLMEFQVEGVRFALQHGGRALIADEMGLGKTLQALAVVSCLKEDWPVLIIVPSSLRVHWANMVVTWLQVCPSDITIVMSTGNSRAGYNIMRTTGKHKVLVNGLFNIVSYDSLNKLEDIIMRTGFKIVIADESHYMKNPQAKRTSVCVPVLQRAKYALLLTGTPALSRPIELFKQLQALQPSVYRQINEYGGRYCMGGFFGQWQGSSNRDELHALMKSTVMIRRLKLDVLKQLPKKRREQIFMTLDERGMKQMRALLKELDGIKRDIQTALQVGKKDDISDMKVAERQLISKIYSETAEVKIPAVQEFLETMLEGGCKFLVFGHHQIMMDAIQEFLQKKKVKFIRIDGKTHPGSRQDLVKTFQETEDVRVAVLGIRAAGVGLTLTAASTVVFAEMSWTPGDLVQAEDRAHRIGQESAVNVYYLHAHDTIDDFLWDAVQHKLENLGQVLDGQEDSTMSVVATECESGSQVQGQSTLDEYMQPCAKSSANDQKQPSSFALTDTSRMLKLNPCSSKRKREDGQVGQVIDLTDSSEVYLGSACVYENTEILNESDIE